eukprot:TRINITY_DN4292_c0_g4_i5.p1 TRINITY_DN4292_c0_g4~~TRINITY_DN4292_c0_g4_i5.p1  ORF type:complete len:1178 (-),score=277.94 TRINITY_DN4292_c0_g4_i5:413-3946(-)
MASERLPVEVFTDWCDAAPDKMLFTWLDEQGNSETVWTRDDVRQRANAVAHALQSWGCVPGDRAICMYLPGLDFTAAFWGCLFCNVVAVPVYPVDLRKFEVSVTRFGGIVSSCNPKLVLSHGPYLRMKRLVDLKNVFGTASWPEGLDFKSTDSLPSTTVPADTPAIQASDLAFLQYTSGSTGDPKGVMVSHYNLKSNLAAFAEQVPMVESSKGCCWAPQYHDAGLIGNLLMSCYCGGSCVVMSPITFIRSPAIWLQAITKHKCTVSFAPNFGYELVCKKITDKQLQALDLSSVLYFANGAEPVRASTMRDFAAKFTPVGLDPAVLSPVWGLAEYIVYCSGRGHELRNPDIPVTLCVDPSKLEAGEVCVVPSGTREFVACGRPATTVQIAVVDPATGQRVLAGRVGELWAAGPSKASGYWGKPELTVETFANTLGGDLETQWLRSGDLGFMHEGQVFVCGRLKDVLIVRGRNIYPQDIEKTVEASNSALRAGCSAAFVIEEQGEEQLAMLAEVQDGDEGAYRAIAERLCEAVAAEHNLRCHSVLLLKIRTVPKTTSGKIQRRKCQSEFLRWQSNHAYAPPSQPFSDWWMFSGVLVTVLGARWGISDALPLYMRMACCCAAVALVVFVGLCLKKKHPNPDGCSLQVLYAHTSAKGGAPSTDAPVPDTKPASTVVEQPGPELSLQESVHHVVQALIIRKVHEVADVVVSPDTELMDSGLDSLSGADLSNALQEELGASMTLSGSILFEHPTAAEVSTHVCTQLFAPRLAACTRVAPASEQCEVGVVGMACHASGVQSTTHLWKTLMSGSVHITHTPPQRWTDVWPSTEPFAGAFISDLGASVCATTQLPTGKPMDLPLDLHLSTLIDVLAEAVRTVPSKPTTMGIFTAVDAADFTLAAPSFLISHVVASALRADGPHDNFMSACSGGYLAVARGLQAIAQGECTHVAVGGGFLMLKPDSVQLMSARGMMSNSGKMQPLSAKADGMLCGEACAAIVLQRDAPAETSFASMLGAANSKNSTFEPVGFVDATEIGSAAWRALCQAQVDPVDVNLVHLHAMGNPASDGPEADGVMRVLLSGDRSSPLLLVGHKANIGHSVAASGVLAVIVTALALRNRAVPPLLGVEKPIKCLRGREHVLLPSEVMRMGGGVVHGSVSGTSMSGDNTHLVLRHSPELNKAPMWN